VYRSRAWNFRGEGQVFNPPRKHLPRKEQHGRYNATIVFCRRGHGGYGIYRTRGVVQG